VNIESRYNSLEVIILAIYFFYCLTTNLSNFDLISTTHEVIKEKTSSKIF